jgi:hypothetical protein
VYQVLAALGREHFELILPDILKNCSHQKASVRDGHLTLFKVIYFLYRTVRTVLKYNM